jgi:hypothetical protein
MEIAVFIHGTGCTCKFMTTKPPENGARRRTFRYEMRHLVESCGLVVEAEYSDFQRSSPEYGKEQIRVLSRH